MVDGALHQRPLDLPRDLRPQSPQRASSQCPLPPSKKSPRCAPRTHLDLLALVVELVLDDGGDAVLVDGFSSWGELCKRVMPQVRVWRQLDKPSFGREELRGQRGGGLEWVGIGSVSNLGTLRRRPSFGCWREAEGQSLHALLTRPGFVAHSAGIAADAFWGWEGEVGRAVSVGYQKFCCRC